MSHPNNYNLGDFNNQDFLYYFGGGDGTSFNANGAAHTLGHGLDASGNSLRQVDPRALSMTGGNFAHASGAANLSNSRQAGLQDHVTAEGSFGPANGVASASSQERDAYCYLIWQAQQRARASLREPWRYSSDPAYLPAQAYSAVPHWSPPTPPDTPSSMASSQHLNGQINSAYPMPVPIAFGPDGEFYYAPSYGFPAGFPTASPSPGNPASFRPGRSASFCPTGSSLPSRTLRPSPPQQAASPHLVTSPHQAASPQQASPLQQVPRPPGTAAVPQRTAATHSQHPRICSSSFRPGRMPGNLALARNAPSNSALAGRPSHSPASAQERPHSLHDLEYARRREEKRRPNLQADKPAAPGPATSARRAAPGPSRPNQQAKTRPVEASSSSKKRAAKDGLTRDVKREKTADSRADPASATQAGRARATNQGSAAASAAAAQFVPAPSAASARRARVPGTATTLGQRSASEAATAPQSMPTQSTASAGNPASSAANPEEYMSWTAAEAPEVYSHRAWFEAEQIQPNVNQASSAADQTSSTTDQADFNVGAAWVDTAPAAMPDMSDQELEEALTDWLAQNKKRD